MWDRAPMTAAGIDEIADQLPAPLEARRYQAFESAYLVLLPGRNVQMCKSQKT